MEIKIKKLDSADSDGFRELRLEFLEKYPASFGMDSDNEAYKSLDFFRDKIVQNYMLGAFDGDQLVGVIAFSPYRSAKEMHKGYIFSFGLTESYRGNGIGRRILNHLIEDVRKNFPAVEQILLKVESLNHPAYNLYASMGFQEYATEKQSLKIGDQYFDHVLMVKWM